MYRYVKMCIKSKIGKLTNHSTHLDCKNFIYIRQGETSIMVPARLGLFPASLGLQFPFPIWSIDFPNAARR